MKTNKIKDNIKINVKEIGYEDGRCMFQLLVLVC